MNKKGFSLMQMIPIVLVLVVAGITIALGQNVLTDFQDDQTANSYAYNSTGDALEANNTISGYLPTIGLVIAVVIVLGILVTYLVRRF